MLAASWSPLRSASSLSDLTAPFATPSRSVPIIDATAQPIGEKPMTNEELIVQLIGRVATLEHLLAGHRPWRAHGKHFCQRLVRLGWGHRKTVVWGYALMLVCAGSAAVALSVPPRAQAWLLSGSRPWPGLWRARGRRRLVAAVALGALAVAAAGVRVLDPGRTAGLSSSACMEAAAMAVQASRS